MLLTETVMDPPVLGGRVFTEMGANPTRASTITNHAAAVKLLNDFLTAKGMSPLPNDKNGIKRKNVCKEGDVCQIAFLRQFATFIKELKNSDDTWRFRPGPGKNKLGDAKGQIERIFGKDCWVRNDKKNSSVTGTRFNEKGPEAWYPMLRKNLHDEMFYRCYNSGNRAVFVWYLLTGLYY